MENIVGEAILDALEDMDSGSSERANFSLMLHFVVFDTQRAIFDLIVLKHFGAASALLRVLLESHIKAQWLNLCATDKQIEQFKKDNVKSKINKKYNVTIKEMVEQIEEIKPHLNGSFREFQKYHWKGLNSFTHSGTMQLRKFTNSTEGYLESMESLAASIQDFSNRLAIGSLGETGSILCNNKIKKTYLELADSILGIKPS